MGQEETEKLNLAKPQTLHLPYQDNIQNLKKRVTDHRDQDPQIEDQLEGEDQDHQREDQAEAEDQKERDPEIEVTDLETADRETTENEVFPVHLPENAKEEDTKVTCTNKKQREQNTIQKILRIVSSHTKYPSLQFKHSPVPFPPESHNAR